MGRQVRLGLERKARQLKLFKYVWPVFVLLILCGVGAYAGQRLLSSRMSIRSEPSTPRQAAVTFLRHLLDDRTDAAYAQLCTATQRTYDRTAFAAYAHAHKISSFPNPPRGTPSSSPGGVESAAPVSVEYFELNYANNTTELHGIPIVQEPGGYRICGNPY
jgi:hypothetical protein